MQAQVNSIEEPQKHVNSAKNYNSTIRRVVRYDNKTVYYDLKAALLNIVIHYIGCEKPITRSRHSSSEMPCGLKCKIQSAGVISQKRPMTPPLLLHDL